MKNKRAIEINFAWIFAIVIGVVIILLAVYATIKLVGTEKKITDSEVAQQISILLSPIETTLESGKTATITTQQETRIYNDCDLAGNFGTQKLSASTSSGLGNKWEKPAIPSRFYNKYVFSPSVIQGKSFYVLAKPFSMPYKIADLVFLWSENNYYCFVNPPNDISEDIENLNLKNTNISSEKTKCPINSTKVCFTTSGCDVDVNINAKSVKKQGQKTENYIDTNNNALLFGAIFSDSAIYDCQLQRLRLRASELASLYASKSNFLEGKGCTSNVLQGQLMSYYNMTRNFNISINTIETMSNQLEEENHALQCELF